MAYWIELRCEDRDKDYADLSYHEKCWSYNNSGMGLLADDNVDDLLRTRRLMEADAKLAGWKKLKRGWVCPHCVEQAPLSPDSVQSVENH